MESDLVYYDFYPKVAPCRRPVTLNVRPLGRHARFEEGRAYCAYVIPMNHIARRTEDVAYAYTEARAEDGTLRFTATFPSEQRYEIWLSAEPVKNGAGRRWYEIPKTVFHVYALEDDLLALRPLRGNLHAHSFRSDGAEAPEMVAAWYRRAGYDFLAITDHGQYAPSLEAAEAYADAPVDMLLLPGEEVHAPDNKVHIVHFGGSHSVNELYRREPERYREETGAIRQALPPEIGEANAFELASSEWVFRRIAEAGGLSVLCHPDWVTCGAYNVDDDLLRYFLRHPGYDALELVNGGNQPEENQLQIASWHSVCAPDRRPAVVGSDDSHGAVNGEWFDIGKTYALARRAERGALLDAIRGGLCCAAEQYHGEKRARVYGPERLVRYFTFLEREYFPLHDELCREEGRLMLAHIGGDADAADRLRACAGQTRRLWEHIAYCG